MSSFLLKIIACFTMLIDHIGYVFFPTATYLRIIGRIAMPIFAFQIGIGFKKTRCKYKYILRMFICALISEIPFLLMLNANSFPNLSNLTLNICFTFTIALLILYFLEESKKSPILFLPVLFLILISCIVPMDYSIYAVALVVIFYLFQDKKIIYSILFLIVALAYYFIKSSLIQPFMLLALPFIWLYNGQKGKSFKYYFYAFYPMHMLIFFILNLFLK